MTERTELTDEALDALFQAGRASAPTPSEALLARVMDQAMVETASRARAAPAATPRRQRAGLLAGGLAAVGGWPSMAGLATAGIVGLWIGYAGPVGLDTVATAMLGGGYQPADMLPSLDTFLQEG